MKLRTRLILLKTWAILFLAFAGLLVVGLFVGEYFLGLANAYPGYDLKMFFQGAVHTTRYLTWSQVFFNFDAVVSNFLHDVLVAFFLAGVYLHFMPRRDHGSASPQGGKNLPLARVWRAELAIGILVVAIIVTSLLGASGLFGYQEAGVEGRLLLVQGLDDFQLNSFIYPFILVISGAGTVGFIFLHNLSGTTAGNPLKGRLVMSCSILGFGLLFLVMPLHLEIPVNPHFLEVFLRYWLVIIVTNAIMAFMKARRMIGASAGTISLDLDANIKLKQLPIKPWKVALLNLPYILVLIPVAIGLIQGTILMSAEPALVFQATFNMIFCGTCTFLFFFLFEKIAIGGRS